MELLQISSNLSISIYLMEEYQTGISSLWSRKTVPTWLSSGMLEYVNFAPILELVLEYLEYRVRLMQCNGFLLYT